MVCSDLGETLKPVLSSDWTGCCVKGHFKMTKILVVGGGLTAAVTSSLLKASPNSKNRVVKVWDKAKNVGGRMSTLKCQFNPALTADLGAQYITITPSSNRY